MWLYYSFSFLGFLGVLFTLWMLIYCLRNDPDRYVWMWVMFIFGPLGGLLYFFVRYLPTKSLGSLPFAKWFRRGKELKKLAWRCKQIDNAHQWVEYGDALREASRGDEARDAYHAALEREKDSLSGLWGAASVAFQKEAFAEARGYLERLLAIDPRYKFGDPSLLLGKTLIQLDHNDAAQVVIKDHIQAHRTPEALYLLGQLQTEAGQLDEARATYQSLIEDLENAPRAIVRKSMFWRSRAKRALRSL